MLVVVGRSTPLKVVTLHEHPCQQINLPMRSLDLDNVFLFLEALSQRWNGPVPIVCGYSSATPAQAH